MYRDTSSVLTQCEITNDTSVPGQSISLSWKKHTYTVTEIIKVSMIVAEV